MFRFFGTPKTLPKTFRRRLRRPFRRPLVFWFSLIHSPNIVLFVTSSEVSSEVSSGISLGVFNWIWTLWWVPSRSKQLMIARLTVFACSCLTMACLFFGYYIAFKESECEHVHFRRQSKDGSEYTSEDVTKRIIVEECISENKKTQLVFGKVFVRVCGTSSEASS